MRKVNRAAVPFPSALKASQTDLLNQEIIQYLSLDSNLRGQKRPPLKLEILNDNSILQALKTLFFDKCAYCETPLHGTERHVDHFRPTSNGKLGERRYEDHDLYVWFSYQWENLLLVCERCNKAKGTQFPVRGKPAPLLSTWEEANRIERPLLVNPCLDNPEEHFAMDARGLIVPLTQKGRTTLSVLPLNEKHLQRERYELINLLDSKLLAQTTNPNEFPWIRERLREMG